MRDCKDMVGGKCMLHFCACEHAESRAEAWRRLEEELAQERKAEADAYPVFVGLVVALIVTLLAALVYAIVDVGRGLL